MENQFIKHWEFKPLTIKAINSYIDKYGLVFSKSDSFGVDLKNDKIQISISDRVGDFSIGISNGKNYLTINELVFRKYPDYIVRIKNDKTINPFKFSADNFNLYNDYFVYLVKTSFDFIEDNFPQIFRGEF